MEKRIGECYIYNNKLSCPYHNKDLNAPGESNTLPCLMIPGNRLLIENTIDVNIGTKDRPHILKLRADLTSDKVTEYSELLKELQDILTWNYKDILGIDPKLVVYNLLLKANAKPIKQKLRCH